jgi:hypothetical protein
VYDLGAPKKTTKPESIKTPAPSKIEQGLKLQDPGSSPQRLNPTSLAPFPEILTMETPPLPAGVAGATIVSSTNQPYIKFKQILRKYQPF